MIAAIKSIPSSMRPHCFWTRKMADGIIGIGNKMGELAADGRR